MFALGVDTSNYATSLAVVNCHSGEVVCALKRFLPVKDGELGLRQNDALFHHTVALPQLFADIAKQHCFTTISAVGVSVCPRPDEGSYMPCFLAGQSFATAFAAGAGCFLAKTSHQQGHLASAIYGAEKKDFLTSNLLFFHASGGTTQLLLTNGYNIIKSLGQSLDLFAGQAVDRLGLKLGFSFPAGQHVSNLAQQCNENICPKISVKGFNCNLSGLENQCQKLLAQGKSKEYTAKFCLVSIAETAKKMLENARQEFGNLPILCAGGVMCSSTIRTRLFDMDNIAFAPGVLSADNAVGVALIAAKEAKLG